MLQKIPNESINWQHIKRKLPISNNKVDGSKVIAFIQEIDTDRSGWLSKEEVMQGVNRFGKSLGFVFQYPQVIEMAFNKAIGTRHDDFNGLFKREIKIFFQFLYMYWDYYMFFKEKNEWFDDFITIKEFKKSQEILSQYDINMEDYKAQFQQIDKLKSGKISFNQFAERYTEPIIQELAKEEIKYLNPQQNVANDAQTKILQGQIYHNQSYLFKPKFQESKKKKEIVTQDVLNRQLEKLEYTNNNLKEEIERIKKELEFIIEPEYTSPAVITFQKRFEKMKKTEITQIQDYQ